MEPEENERYFNDFITRIPNTDPHALKINID